MAFGQTARDLAHDLVHAGEVAAVDVGQLLRLQEVVVQLARGRRAVHRQLAFDEVAHFVEQVLARAFELGQALRRLGLPARLGDLAVEQVQPHGALDLLRVVALLREEPDVGQADVARRLLHAARQRGRVAGQQQLRQGLPGAALAAAGAAAALAAAFGGGLRLLAGRRCGGGRRAGLARRACAESIEVEEALEGLVEDGPVGHGLDQRRAERALQQLAFAPAHQRSGARSIDLRVQADFDVAAAQRLEEVFKRGLHGSKAAAPRPCAPAPAAPGAARWPTRCPART